MKPSINNHTLIKIEKISVTEHFISKVYHVDRRKVSKSLNNLVGLWANIGWQVWLALDECTDSDDMS